MKIQARHFLTFIFSNQSLISYVLLVLVIYILVDKILIMSSLSNKNVASAQIRWAEEQKADLQEILRLSYQIQYDSSKIKILQTKNATWNHTYWALQNGDDKLKLPPIKAANLLLIFRQINPLQIQIYRRIRQSKNKLTLWALLPLIEMNTDLCISLMDKIIQELQTSQQESIWVSLLIQLALVFFTWFLIPKKNKILATPIEEKSLVDASQTHQETISKLQMSNHKLQAILESTPDSHILIDIGYKIVSFNRAAFNQIRALHGKEIIEGNDIRLYITDDLQSSFKDNFARVIQGETIITTQEFEDQHKNKYWFQIRYFPVYNEAQDEITGISFNASNVSKLITQHERLKESESRFRRIADATPVMIWMSNADHQCIYLNKSWLEFTGKNLNQELGNGWLESIHPKDAEYVWETYQVAYQLKHTFEMEWQMRRYDGEYRWVLDKGIPRFSENGDFQGFIGSCIEISDLKSFTEKIERQNGVLRKALTKTRNLAMIVSKTNNLVILTNENGYITWVNPAFNNLTGYSSKEVIGKKPGDLLQGLETNPNTVKKISQAIRHREIIHTEILNYRKNGEKYWVDVLIEPFYDDKKQLIGFMSIQIDITERKENEEKILQQNQSLREIAFIQSHLVRKPVANIIGILDLIEQEELTKENIELLNNLSLSTHELDQIIHEIVHKINALD